MIVVAACPVGLRGHLTRWLLEISAGVFVGRVSARVRDRRWQPKREMVNTARAVLVLSANNQQGLDFRVHQHEWIPIDVEGLTLMLRPNEGEARVDASAERTHGWSTASRRRRFRSR